MFVPNFSPFITLPAVLAQLHLDVLWRLFSNAWFVQVSQMFFFTYFLLLLPLIPLNNNLPKLTTYILHKPAPYLQRQHSGVLVSRQVNL